MNHSKLEQPIASAETVAEKIDALTREAWTLRESEPERAVALAQEALHLLNDHALDDEAQFGEAFFALGWAQSKQGNLDLALETLHRAADFLERAGKKLREASALHFIGNILIGKNQFEAPLEYYFKASGIRERLDDKQGQAASLSNIGLCYEQLGDYATALDYALKALTLRQSISDRFGEAVSLNNIGLLYLRTNNLDRCIEYSEKSLALQQELQYLDGLASTMMNLGGAALKLQRYDDALRWLHQAFERAQIQQNKFLEGSAKISFAMTLQNLERYDDAFLHYNEALQIADALNDDLIKIYALHNRGELHAFLNLYEKAEADLLEAKRLAEQLGTKELLSGSLKSLSQLKEKMGDSAAALDYFKCFHDVHTALSNESSQSRLHNLQITHELQSLQREQELTEQLLFNMLPEPIASRLKKGENLIADNASDVTVLFADIVGFTKLSARISATELVKLLNRIFLAFDEIVEHHGLEKIKTIGDAYLAVGGVPVPRADHAEAVALSALVMLETLRQMKFSQTDTLNVRIGIHTGQVVAGVIGKKKFAFDVWGDTVNTASRMESHGEVGRIHLSEITAHLLQEKFVIEPRGTIDVKGKGAMNTYFLNGKKG
jgi:class 3 adenylate cyclase